MDAFSGQAIAMEPQNFLHWGLERAEQGDWPAALQSYDQALWINPRYVDAYMARGVAYLELGNSDQAIVDFNQALQLEPSSVLGYYNRGCAYYAQERVELALADFQQAIVLDPQFLEAHQQVAFLLDRLGRYADAVPAYEQCLAIGGASTELYHSLGLACRYAGQASRAVYYFQQALHLDPGYEAARQEMRALYHEQVQSWHYWMMNDMARNLPYQRAIEQVVTPQTLVLEIGTGSGLLAMMAARAGAHQVITCEGQDLIADRARQIIQKNGYGDRIQVLSKLSHNLEMPDDLPEPADLLVTEIFGAWLPSEGALEAIRHAHQHLLKPGAVVIPSHADLYLMLIECEELHHRYWVDQALGFDLSCFNEFQYPRPAFMGQIDQHPYRPLSRPYCFAHLNFTEAPADLLETVVTLDIHTDGTLHAVCTWFDLWLDDQVMLTTGPLGDPTQRSRCWGQITPVLYPAMAVRSRQRLSLRVIPFPNTIEVQVQDDLG